MAKKSTSDRFLTFMNKHHTGSEKAIKTDELADIYKLEPRTLQSMIHRLRLDGHPICGDQNGYFYASGSDDIKYTAKWLMTWACRCRTPPVLCSWLPRSTRMLPRP